MLVVGHDAEVASWAVERIPHLSSVDALGPYVAMGIARDGEMLAACIYHRWVPEYQSCEMTFAAASPRWATRGMIRGLLAVPFEQYGCQRVSAVLPHDAARTEKFVRGIGFKREGCARRGFGGRQHALLYGMLRGEYDRLWKRVL